MGVPFPDQPQDLPDAVKTSLWPETESDQEAVRQQMDRILASKRFVSSKRYPVLLKYVVDETLAGRANYLKERTLGVEVFGRDPSYDSNLDPVVRTSAAQVRRRLAQYYAEASGESEVRIDLLPGGYVPIFRQILLPGNGDVHSLRDAPAEVAQAGGAPVETATEVLRAQTAARRAETTSEPQPVSVRSPRKWLALYALLFVATGLLAWAVASRWFEPSTESKFWAPVWDKSTSAVICVPGSFPTNASVASISDGTRLTGAPISVAESLRLNSIAWPDATTLYRIVGFIEKYGQPYHVRRAGESALSDLRTGPVILIGGLNNPWIMRLTSSYRYSYRYDRDEGVAWIQDSQTPERALWKVAVETPYSTFDEDYGMITRVWDPTTERLTIVASGIASYGTIAAGEFLTNPRYLEMVAQRAPRGWENRNLQVIFKTKVFSGNASPPVIVAVHVW